MLYLHGMRTVNNPWIRFLRSLALTGIAMALVLIPACRKNTIEPPIAADKPYYSYYPLATGNEYIYDVDSVYYEPFVKRSLDTLHYQIREAIDTSFPDNTGTYGFKLFRYRRMKETDDWGTPRVYFTKRTKYYAERVDENIRYVKLTFPVELNAMWKGYMFNTLDSLDQYHFKYSEVHKKFTDGANSYDSTLTVIQADYEDAIQRLKGTEKYASGIGLVYLQMIDTTTVNRKGVTFSGGIVTYHLKSYIVK